MNGSFVPRKQTRKGLYALLIVPWLVLLICLPLRSLPLSCLFGFVAVMSTFLSLTLLLMPSMQREGPREQPLPQPSQETSSSLPLARSQKLPSLPQTLAELYKMTSSDFELLSAAVLVAHYHYRFLSHTGKRGDRGVDVRLQNYAGLLVIVQCKRNAASNPVGPEKIRELGGTLQTQGAAYGYLVTSSAFTAAAYQEKADHGHLYTIDGPHLVRLLQQKPLEIAQALDAIHKKKENPPG